MAAMHPAAGVSPPHQPTGGAAGYDDSGDCRGSSAPATVATFRGNHVWEFNVRSSTVLGVVGAGGIGQELKNSVDLLDFARLFTIILIILAMVTAIDQFSAWLRRRLV